jgi:hypothetical protein
MKRSETKTVVTRLFQVLCEKLMEVLNADPYPTPAEFLPVADKIMDVEK